MTKKPYSLNDEIQDRTIRHMVYLERYKTAEVRKIRKMLDTIIIPEISAKIEKRLDKILERGSDLGSDTTKRLKELEAELKKLTDDLANGLKKASFVNLDDLTEHELDWQVKAIKDSLGFNLDLVVPNPRSVASVVKKTSFAGLTLDQWYESLSRSTQKNVMVAINRGILEGETTDQITRRIRGTRKLNYSDGIWETTRRQAETITRSTVNHVTNQARVEFFKDNSDIIDGMKWVATLDSRTSAICAGLDGKVFPLDKGPRPPAHPNCRSTMTAVLKDADALGLDDLDPAQRASIDGQVPASTTYGEWLKRQPQSVQEDVLGVKKAKLFRDGGLPIDRFTNDSLKPLNLDQLKILEKNAFEKAGLNV